MRWRDRSPTTSTAPCNIWYVVSSFSFTSRYFLISLWFLFRHIDFLTVCHLVFTYLWIFQISFYYWFLILFSVIKKYTLLFQSFLVYWGLSYGLAYGLSWRIFLLHLREKCIFCCWVECSVGLLCLLASPTIVELSLSPFISVYFYCMYFWCFVRCIYNCYVLLNLFKSVEKTGKEIHIYSVFYNYTFIIFSCEFTLLWNHLLSAWRTSFDISCTVR